MNKLTLVIDMDECVCDLSDTIRLRVNKDFNKNYPKGFNKSYWWADYHEVQKSYFEELLNEKGLFLNLEPVEGSIETLTKLHEEGFDIHILTCPQINSGDCFYEKISWVQKYLPFINTETNFHTTGNKGMFAKENRALIDDNSVYLQQFLDNGGIPIAFNQHWNSAFEGYRAYNWQDVYETIHTIDSFVRFSGLCERLKNNVEKEIDVENFRKYMNLEHNE